MTAARLAGGWHVKPGGRTLPLMIRLLTILALLCACLLPGPPAAADEAEEASRRQLRDIRRDMQQAERARARLDARRRALAKELKGVTDQLVALAARRQSREARVSRNAEEIRRLERRREKLRDRLRAERRAIAELLAALQRLQRDPPPPFVTRPDDVLGAVRGAMLLAVATPQMERKAVALRESLREMAAVRRRLRAEQARMRRDVARLRALGDNMRALLQRKRALLEQTEERLDEESRRIARLTERARTLEQLLAALRREAKRRAEAARRKAAREERERATGRRAALPSLPPRQPLAGLKGRLPWPAQGRVLAAFGDRLPLGRRARGVYVRTLPGATVIAPADARVELARPFRSYGLLLILDAGDGYRILLAGLRKAVVKAGQRVRSGEPVGEMGDRPAPATAIAERMDDDRPVLYVELRHKGQPVDSAGWWLGAGKQARQTPRE